MHYEILVEGQTELTVLSTIMAQILGEYGEHNTWKIHKHRGVGELPKNMSDRPGTNILWKFAVQLQSVLLATEAVQAV